MSEIVNKKYKHSELTGAIIGCAMKVHSALGTDKNTRVNHKLFDTFYLKLI